MSVVGGIKDRGVLFARAYLDSCVASVKEGQQLHLLETVREWFLRTDRSSLGSLVASFVGPVLDVLGFVRSELRGNVIALFEDRSREKALSLCYVVNFDENLDQTAKGKNYAVSLIMALKKAGLRWGILTNGSFWRLYCVKEKAPFETFFQINLGEVVRTRDSVDMTLFADFFGVQVFVVGEKGKCRLDANRRESDEATRQIEEHLQGKMEDILGKLCMGFIQSEGRKSYTEEEKRAVFNNSIYLLYRILFILYAEARGFLPLQDSEYYEKSMARLTEIAKENHSKGIENPTGRAMWNALREVFSWVNQGNRAMGIPPYNGGLFDDSEKTYLANHAINDAFLSEALFSLGFREERGNVVPINYNDLSVRHLGGLYEGILEYQLFIAPERMVRRKDKNVYRFIPESQAGKITRTDIVIEKGDVYFSQSSEERKMTGSYYTPEDIVRYIVENSLGQYLADIDKELQALVCKLSEAHGTAVDDRERRSVERFIDKEVLSFLEKKVLSIKILDPAMGSGHFLVNASHFLANYIVESLSLTEWENDSVDTSPLLWRRRVVEKCIFGVDLNQLATELAKLSLWLVTADIRKPLTFLDHHLRTGNSLLGTELDNLGALPSKNEPRSARSVQTTLNYPIFEKEFIPKVLQAFREMEDSSEEIEDIERKKRRFKEWEALKRSLQGVADTWLATFFGYQIEEDRYESMLNEAMDGKDVRIDEKVQEIACTQGNMFFHWWLEFPEVFGFSKKNGPVGFDVVIGNPPYIRIESLNRQLADIYKRLYESLHQRCDIYVAFMQTSFEKINNCGIVGLITGNQYMVAEYGLKIRELLVSRYGILKIVNFTHYSVFPGVSVYSSILIGSKRPQENVRCIAFESESAMEFMTQEGLSDDIKHPGIMKSEISVEHLRKGEWSLKGDYEAKILEKIKSKKVKKLSTISLIGSPLKTGRDAVLYYVLKNEDAEYFYVEREGETTRLEKPIWKRILRPRLLDKWTCGEPNTIVFFPYKEDNGKFELIDETEFREKFPLTFELMLKFKDILLERKDSRKTWREHGRPWYSLHRIGVPKNYSETKILTQSIIRQPSFCIETKGYFYPTGGVLGIVPNKDVDAYFLLAYLNSNLAYFLLKSKAPAKRGGYISLDVGLTSKILIPLDEKLSSELSSLTIELLKNPKLTRELEERINAVVYSFFGMAEAERKIIEESLK